MFKFRSMVKNAAAIGPYFTSANDPRITRVGAFLRRTRIDELPQFIDVLLGHMSLVGPRPEVPRFVALYPPELRARVLAVRPGITDPASLAFIDEARLLAAAADPKLQHAAEYAERASLATDLGVLWRTLRLLLRQV